MSDTRWMIYGASGYTGTLVAEEAVRRGHRPVLAGRSAAKLAPLAERLGLEWLVIDLSDSTALNKAVAGVDLVLNAAGPFVATSAPLVAACLAGRTHYLDIANEAPVFRTIYALDAEARQKGVALIPGIGFGVVVTNTLVRHVCTLVPDATTIECAIAADNNAQSAGATQTALDVLPLGAYIYTHGRRKQIAFGTATKRVRFPDKERGLLPVPLGDLEAARRTTGVPTVISYVPFSVNPLTPFILPIVRRVLAVRFIRQQIGRLVERQVRRAKPQPPRTYRSFGWARATNAAGAEIQAWLETGEGYAFTASVSVRAVERVFADAPHGALTPVDAFGPDFGLDIPGVTRYDSLT